MNTSHYPSLDLCKKLTEAGFPIVEKFWQYGKICDSFRDCMIHKDAEVCPSVMELLNEIPKEIKTIGAIGVNLSGLIIHFNQIKEVWSVSYGINKSIDYITNETLPNALAEMWLWLKENGYLLIK